MTWKTLIQPGQVWSGVEMYADERIAELAQVCISGESSELLIRQAQAGIEELRRLKNIPGQLKATADQTRNSGKRTGY